MQGAGGAVDEEPERRFRRVRLIPLVAVLLVGIAATVLVWRRADDDVARRDLAVAHQATDRLTNLVSSIQAGLAGADGVVEPDGTVDLEAFRAYATGVVAATALDALGYEPLVTEAERPAFEARLGVPMVERPSAGAAPAAPRAVHYPVAEVVPMLDVNRSVRGFDIASDPVRREAAERSRDRGTVVFSEPVPSQPTGRLSFFLVRPLYRPGLPVDTVAQRRAALVGFVSTAYVAQTLRDDLAAGLPRGTRFLVRDGDTVLATTGHEHDHVRVRTSDATGRRWTLEVSSPGGPSRAAAALIAAVTALLVAALGLVVQRTNRYEAGVRRSTVHLQALAAFATGLAPRRSSDDVMSYLTGGVLDPLEAFHAAVGVVEGDQLRRYFTPGPLTESARAVLPASNPLDSDTPLTEAAREDRSVLLPSTDEMRSRYPHLVDAWTAAGFGATANVPLHDRQGVVIGALGVAWDHPVRFDDDLVGRLTTVAGIAGQSLERARLADAEHRLVDALQSDVLGPLPDAPRLAMAARYLPAARAVGMGGDWFEGILLDDGRYVVVVGDIAGHGITAVGQMAQFRSMLGTLIRLGTPLSELVERASRSVEGTGRIATAVVVAIDAEAGTLEYVAAGHPPPILRMPDGTTRLLSDGRRPLIGVTRRSDASGTHEFPVGASLLCYTDGLIERRTESIDLSVRNLAERFAAIAPGDPERIADELLAASLPAQDQQTDDVALAVITRR
jgi:GAF domain-containing protein